MPTKQTTGMYNEEQKREFIDEVLSGDARRVRACELFFFALAPYEKAWGGDVATRSADEITSATTKLLGLRTQSRYGKLSILKKYIEWCVVKGYATDADKVRDLDRVTLTKIRNETISSPGHLQRYLDTVFRKEDDHTVDNIFRSFFWLAFGGLDESAVMEIKCSDFDFDSMSFSYNGESFEIYREGVKALKYCVTATQFQYIHDSPEYRTYLDRVPGDTMMRGIRLGESEKALRVSVSKKTRDAFGKGLTAMQINYYRAWLSGIFYRKYVLETAGVEIDFRDTAARYMRDKEYFLHGKKIDPHRKMLRVANDYLKDYERWKAAHYIF